MTTSTTSQQGFNLAVSMGNAADPQRRTWQNPTTEGNQREIFGQGRPMAKDSSGAGANWYAGTLSQPQSLSQGNVNSRLFFEGTVTATDMSRATDAREKGRIGIFGTAESYGGSYPRVTSEAIGRDLNPLGRGNGQALVAGMLNLGAITPTLPSAVLRGGWKGNSVNNPGGEGGACGGGGPRMDFVRPDSESTPSAPNLPPVSDWADPPPGCTREEMDAISDCKRACARERRAKDALSHAQYIAIVFALAELLSAILTTIGGLLGSTWIGLRGGNWKQLWAAIARYLAGWLGVHGASDLAAFIHQWVNGRFMQGLGDLLGATNPANLIAWIICVFDAFRAYFWWDYRRQVCEHLNQQDECAFDCYNDINIACAAGWRPRHVVCTSNWPGVGPNPLPDLLAICDAWAFEGGWQEQLGDWIHSRPSDPPFVPKPLPPHPNPPGRPPSYPPLQP